MKKTWADLGVEIPAGATGECRTKCPSCSEGRKKKMDLCFAVNIDIGTAFCHHCGFSTGLMQKNVKIFNRPKFVESELPEKVLTWFSGRGISEKTLAKNKIGYGNSFAGKNGIHFPYIKNGNVVNVKHRTGDKMFRQEKNAEKCLYRFDSIVAIQGSTLIITEGEIDALSFVEAGYSTVVSIPDGAPSANSSSYRTKFNFLDDAMRYINKFKKIILAVDSDEPGKRAEEELSRRIGRERCYVVKYPEGCKDANEALVAHGVDSLTQIVKTSKPFPIEGIFSAKDVSDNIQDIFRFGYQRGLYLGWHGLKDLFSIKMGEMTIITGIPGSGKSNFVDAMMINLANSEDMKFAIFSPENWPIQRHVATMIEKVTELSFHGFDKMAEDEMEDGLDFIDSHFKYIVPPETTPCTIDAILDYTKIIISRDGISGLVLDPWNEVEHEYGRLTETQYISKELTKIRRFARLHQIHIFVVAHPRNLRKNDDGTYKPPSMYEISGGANWRNKADNGICVHRNNYETTEVRILIQKIRFREVGKIGECTLIYDRKSTTYSDRGGNREKF